MAMPITPKTVVATFHHARQSDLDPSRAELDAWRRLLQANYERILPAEMARHGLDPNDPQQVDLTLLLAELTEGSGVLARTIRGCNVAAGLQRSGLVPLDRISAAPRPARAKRKRRKASKRRKPSSA